MAAKKKVRIDGEEIPGLVMFGEVNREKNTIEVPEFFRKRFIQSGIYTVPQIEATYKVERNSSTLKFFKDWFNNNEVHDVTVVHCDAHGVEYHTQLLPKCELNNLVDPAFDAANPTYAQVKIRLLPEDVKDIL